MCEAHAAWYWTSQQEQFIDRSILSHHTEQGTKQLSTLKTNWLFVSACHTGMLAENRIRNIKVAVAIGDYQRVTFLT